MSNVTYCDFCNQVAWRPDRGNEVALGVQIPSRRLSFYNEHRVLQNQDVCDSCMEKLSGFLKTLKLDPSIKIRFGLSSRDPNRSDLRRAIRKALKEDSRVPHGTTHIIG